ncbi:hypothetical protein HMPREF2863_05635 [Micrococcus sp. HMSC067E09]|nr:hypothetical protein HMPREF2863_05635 [Micrococcus sp. HMSC067E09]
MSRSAPIPDALLWKAFTIAEAEAAGVSYHRLRGPSFERVGHGRYRYIDSQLVRAAAEQTGVGEQEIYRWSPLVPPPSAVMLLEILARCPDAVVSHATAARLRNFWLPSRLVADDRLHVTRSRSRGVLKDRWVVTHRSDLPRHHSTPLVLVGHSIRVTAPERLWTELATELTDDELVILGDHLIRRSGRSRRAVREKGPHLLERFRQALDSPGARPQRRRLRAALQRIRIGADSPKETELRLALIAAGLPEPELQIEEWDADYSADFPATADMGWRSARIVLQYEGAHHSHRIDEDVRRDAVFQRKGYTVIRVSASDAKDGFRGVIARVRARLGTERQAG